MKRITGKQSKTARSLLKWNPYDLASRTHVHIKRIDSFERGFFQLHQGEMDEVMRVFNEGGIVFGEDFSVRLVEDGKSHKIKDSGYRPEGGVHIVVDANEMLKIQGIELTRPTPAAPAITQAATKTKPEKPAE